MLHELVQTYVNDINVEYMCSKCGKAVAFNKAGIGDPFASDNGDGTWAHPENPEIWMGPCNS